MYSDPLGGNENNARTIKGAPMMRIKYANYINTDHHEDGLLGFVGGFGFNPDFQAGHFVQSSTMIPAKYSLNFNFEPVHEKPLGASYSNPETFLDEAFPYSAEKLSVQVPLTGDSTTRARRLRSRVT